MADYVLLKYDEAHRQNATVKMFECGEYANFIKTPLEFAMLEGENCLFEPMEQWKKSVARSWVGMPIEKIAYLNLELTEETAKKYGL